MSEECKTCPERDNCDNKKMVECALAELPQQNLASAKGNVIDCRTVCDTRSHYIAGRMGCVKNE